MMLIDQIQEYSDDELELEVESSIKKLRPQQRKIIEVYSQGDITLKAAAEQAGLKSGAAASNALKSPAGSWALSCLREQHARQSKATAAWKQTRLKEIINIAMTQEKPDLRAAVSAIGELNKMSGDHAATKQKVEHHLLSAHVSIDGMDLELLSKLHHTLQSHDRRIIESTATPALKNATES